LITDPFARLLDSSAHRHHRFKRQSERLAIKVLHRFEIVGEDTNINGLLRELHEFSPD